MTKEELFKALELAIKEKLEAEAKIQVLKLRLKFGEANLKKPENKPEPRRTNSNVELFITAHEGKLDAEDIEFLRLREADCKTVSKYLTQNNIAEIVPATVSRHIGTPAKPGRYSPGPSDSDWRRMVDTVSVVRYHLFRCPQPNETPTEHGRYSQPSKVGAPS